MAFDISWKNIGLGSHKNGRLQGWYDNLNSFTLHAWMDNWLQEPETYRGKELADIIDQAKKAASTARSKKLLTRYALNTSKLRGVKSEKARAAIRGG
jgi:hypothetical protein